MACGHGEEGEVMATPFPEDVPVVVRVLRDVVRARAAEFEAECTESGPAAWLDAVLRCHFERLEAVKAERRCPLDPGPGGE